MNGKPSNPYRRSPWPNPPEQCPVALFHSKEYTMTPQRQHLTAILLGTLTAGFALAQSPGGGMMGGGTKPTMMGGQQGSQMMGGQMMKPEMMRGMVGTMTQMHQMMQKMAGTMEHGGQGMDMKAMADMSKMMDDMAGMMQNMAARMRDGKMDQAMLKTMNERLDAMGKSLKPMQHVHDTKP